MALERESAGLGGEFGSDAPQPTEQSLFYDDLVEMTAIDQPLFISGNRTIDLPLGLVNPNRFMAEVETLILKQHLDEYGQTLEVGEIAPVLIPDFDKTYGKLSGSRYGKPVEGRYVRRPERLSENASLSERAQYELDQILYDVVSKYDDVEARSYSIPWLAQALGTKDFVFTVWVKKDKLRSAHGKHERWGRAIKQSDEIVIFRSGWQSPSRGEVFAEEAAKVVHDNENTVCVTCGPIGWGQNRWDIDDPKDQNGYSAGLKMEKIINSGVFRKLGVRYATAVMEKILGVRDDDYAGKIAHVVHSLSAAADLEEIRKFMEIGKSTSKRSWYLLAPAVFCHDRFSLGNYWNLGNLVGATDLVPGLQQVKSKASAYVLNQFTPGVHPRVRLCHAMTSAMAIDSDSFGLELAMQDLYESQGDLALLNSGQKWPKEVMVYLASEDVLVKSAQVADLLFQLEFPQKQMVWLPKLTHYFWTQGYGFMDSGQVPFVGEEHLRKIKEVQLEYLYGHVLADTNMTVGELKELAKGVGVSDVMRLLLEMGVDVKNVGQFMAKVRKSQLEVPAIEPDDWSIFEEYYLSQEANQELFTSLNRSIREHRARLRRRGRSNLKETTK